jgi:hypothetical protein
MSDDFGNMNAAYGAPPPPKDDDWGVGFKPAWEPLPMCLWPIEIASTYAANKRPPSDTLCAVPVNNCEPDPAVLALWNGCCCWPQLFQPFDVLGRWNHPVWRPRLCVTAVEQCEASNR